MSMSSSWSSSSLSPSLSYLLLRLLLVSLLVSVLASTLLLLTLSVLLDPDGSTTYELDNVAGGDPIDLETIVANRTGSFEPLHQHRQPQVHHLGQFRVIDNHQRHRHRHHKHFDVDGVDNAHLQLPRLRRNASIHLKKGDNLADILPSNLLNLPRVPRLLPPDHIACNGGRGNATTSLVIVIHSAPTHFGHRQSLRQYLRSMQSELLGVLDFGYSFVVGTANDNLTTIETEADTYRDIVRAPFVDTYHNLTYKHLASLRVALEMGNAPCAEVAVDYILKLDDDAFLNLPSIAHLLIDAKRALLAAPGAAPVVANFLACSLFPAALATPRTGKWALSRSAFPFDRLPAYCSGLAYLLSADVAFDVLEGANRLQRYAVSVDDLFLTGLVAVASLDQPPLSPVALNVLYEYSVPSMWAQAKGNDSSDARLSSLLFADTGAVEDEQGSGVARPKKSIELRELLWKRLRKRMEID